MVRLFVILTFKSVDENNLLTREKVKGLFIVESAIA